MVVQVFAANTGNGAEKYNTLGPDDATTDTWGHDAVVNRHLMLDGASNPAWMNLHIYNYQKYTHRPYADAGFSGYIDDYNALRSYINADTPGEPALPMALTESNVRTGANTLPTATPIPAQTVAEDHSSAAIPFTVADAETLPENLTVSAATSNPLLLPLSNILLAGTEASRTVQLTPAAGINGQATVTLTVSDGHLGSSFLFVVTVTPDTPWTNWAQAKFAGNWGNVSISGPTAVPDGDSIQNLMEYGLAGNPLAGATFILPRITHGASGVEFRFPRNTAATDLRISVESAASLPGVWSEIAVSTSGNPLTATTAGVQVAESSGTLRDVTVTDSRILGATSG